MPMSVPFLWSDRVAFGVGALERQAIARPVEIGMQRSVLWLEHSVEEHLLEPCMVVEVLQVAKRHDRAAGMRMDRRAAVRRELERSRLAERRDAQEPGYPLAAGDVGLQAGDRAGREHLLEVVECVA